MRVLIRSNDFVLISFVQSLLREAGIQSVEMDTHMSALEGSIGAVPRRLAVASEDWDEGARVLRGAGLGEWLARDETAKE